MIKTTNQPPLYPLEYIATQATSKYETAGWFSEPCRFGLRHFSLKWLFPSRSARTGGSISPPPRFIHSHLFSSRFVPDLKPSRYGVEKDLQIRRYICW